MFFFFIKINSKRYKILQKLIMVQNLKELLYFKKNEFGYSLWVAMPRS